MMEAGKLPEQKTEHKRRGDTKLLVGKLKDVSNLYTLTRAKGTQNLGAQGYNSNLNQNLGIGWVGFVSEFHGYFRVGYT